MTLVQSIDKTSGQTKLVKSCKIESVLRLHFFVSLRNGMSNILINNIQNDKTKISIYQIKKIFHEIF